MTNSKTKLLFAGVCVALLAITYVLLSVRTGRTSGTSVSATTSAATTTEETVELVIPDFRAPIAFSPEIATDVRVALKKQADTLSARLATDSLNLEWWIQLGVVRKMGGDFKGAETAWKFVAKLAPTNPIAYNNLGDLYMNFTKEYVKAESAYLAAIKNDPTAAAPYQALDTMYTNFYKQNTSAAVDILKKGIAASPDSVDMHVLLARHYRAAGKSDLAKAQYEAAIAAAAKAGQTDAVEQLKSEENQ